jgi:hypothetical protein
MCVLLIRCHDEGGLPYLANLVDVEGLEALGAPAGHRGAAVMVVDVEG